MAVQQDLDNIKRKAECGDPLYMYEYGKRTIGSNPSKAIDYLERALSKGIGDAGLELVIYYNGKDDGKWLYYLIESAIYDRSLFDNIPLAIANKGDDSSVDHFIEKYNSIKDDSDIEKAKTIYQMVRLYNSIKKNPERFPGHIGNIEKMVDEIDSQINAMISEGLWSDPTIYKLLDNSIGWLDEKHRKKTFTRLDYIIHHNGEEPDNLDLEVNVSDCMMYLQSDSSYAERLEKYVLEGTLSPKGEEIKKCEYYRLSWLLDACDIETDIKTDSLQENWASKDDQFDVGLRYLMMGHHHLVARLAFYISSKQGNADAMFYLGYMIRMNLGEYVWRETTYLADNCDTIYHFIKPGDEQTGVEWMEDAVRHGSEIAKDYLMNMSKTGDIEAQFTLKRLNI